MWTPSLLVDRVRRPPACQGRRLAWVLPLALGLALAFPPACEPARPASEQPSATPSTPPSQQPSPPAAPSPGPSSGVPANATFEFTVSGRMAGRLAGGSAEGSLCLRPNAPVDAIFRSRIDGRPATVQVILDRVAPGPALAFIVLVPPQDEFTPPPPGAFTGPGAQFTWSTYQGRALIADDGMSASVMGDLATPGGPIEEHLSGSWTCRRA